MHSDMATSVSADNTTLFKCAICLEKLKTPRDLPCLHSFCELCVQSLIQSSVTEQRDGHKVFECPVCRQEIISDTTNISAEEWTRSFPLNRLVVALEDHGDGKVGIRCVPCSRVDESKPAKYRCNDCRENFCEMCYSYHHRRLKEASSHQISEILENSPQNILDVDENCAIHKNKDIEVYCVDHESLCCSTCLIANHRKCQGVKTVDEILAEKNNNFDMNDLLSLINALKTEATSAKEATVENIKTLETKRSNIMDEVSSHIDEAKDKLDQLRDQFEKKVNQTHFEERQRLEMVGGNLSGFLTTLEDCKAVASTVLSLGSKRQEFFTVERIKLRISNFLKRIDKLKDGGLGRSDYVFTKNSKFYTGTNTILSSDDIGDVSCEISDGSIMLDMENKFHSYCFKCFSNDSSETTFRHTFEDISNLGFTEYMYSPTFKVRNIPWRIDCIRELSDEGDDFFTIYLQCLQKSGFPEWSCNVKAQIRLVNRNFNNESVVKNFTLHFTAAADNNGFDIIKWRNLLESGNGFIENDKITLEVQMKADVPTGLC